MNYITEELNNNTTKITIENKYLDIDVVFRSGQLFNIKKEDNKYTIISKDKICIVIKDEFQTYLYMNSVNKDFWIDYFNFNITFDKYLDKMKSFDNDFIKKCAKYSTGLIIVKQDLWEAMMSFIISQRKSIPSIFTSLERLKENFGKKQNIYLEEIGNIEYTSLPEAKEFIWNDNIETSIEQLRKKSTSEAIKLSSCGLGYRDEYILSAAYWYCSLKKDYMDYLYKKEYKDHMSELMKIKGIGTKVANCICLFSFNDLDAFPIDVWIQRILDKKLIPEDLSSFNGYKGFLQQVIFYYIINNKKEL